MTSLSRVVASKAFIAIINNTYNAYMIHGARSSKKVDYFHTKIKEALEQLFLTEHGFMVKLEYNVPSMNSVGRKKCDIVVLKNDNVYIIFPVKLIMTNYKQNKNNSWENLTGELIHLKWKNENIKLIPINIFMNKTPYLNSKKHITKFETITIKDIDNYNILTEKNICYDVVNYIIDVEHTNSVDEPFTIIPTITGFNTQTPFRCFDTILQDLL